MCSQGYGTAVQPNWRSLYHEHTTHDRATRALTANSSLRDELRKIIREAPSGQVAAWPDAWFLFIKTGVVERKVLTFWLQLVE